MKARRRRDSKSLAERAAPASSPLTDGPLQLADVVVEWVGQKFEWFDLQPVIFLGGCRDLSRRLLGIATLLERGHGQDERGLDDFELKAIAAAVHDLSRELWADETENPPRNIIIRRKEGAI